MQLILMAARVGPGREVNVHRQEPGLERQPRRSPWQRAPRAHAELMPAFAILTHAQRLCPLGPSRFPSALLPQGSPQKQLCPPLCWLSLPFAPAKRKMASRSRWRQGRLARAVMALSLSPEGKLNLGPWGGFIMHRPSSFCCLRVLACYFLCFLSSS